MKFEDKYRLVAAYKYSDVYILDFVIYDDKVLQFVDDPGDLVILFLQQLF